MKMKEVCRRDVGGSFLVESEGTALWVDVASAHADGYALLLIPRRLLCSRPCRGATGTFPNRASWQILTFPLGDD